MVSDWSLTRQPSARSWGTISQVAGRRGCAIYVPGRRTNPGGHSQFQFGAHHRWQDKVAIDPSLSTLPVPLLSPSTRWPARQHSDCCIPVRDFSLFCDGIHRPTTECFMQAPDYQHPFASTEQVLSRPRGTCHGDVLSSSVSRPPPSWCVVIATDDTFLRGT